jgi:hypothetical protein
MWAGTGGYALLQEGIKSGHVFTVGPRRNFLNGNTARRRMHLTVTYHGKTLWQVRPKKVPQDHPSSHPPDSDAICRARAQRCMREDQIVMFCLTDDDVTEEDIEAIKPELRKAVEEEVQRLGEQGGVVPYQNLLPVVVGGAEPIIPQLIEKAVEMLGELALPARPSFNLVSARCELECHVPGWMGDSAGSWWHIAKQPGRGRGSCSCRNRAPASAPARPRPKVSFPPARTSERERGG